MSERSLGPARGHSRGLSSEDEVRAAQTSQWWGAAPVTGRLGTSRGCGESRLPRQKALEKLSHSQARLGPETLSTNTEVDVMWARCSRVTVLLYVQEATLALEFVRC